MKKTWAVSPTSERIVQDILRWPKALRAIIEAEGAVVPFLDNRKGRRKMGCAFEPHASCARALELKRERIERGEDEDDDDWEADYDGADDMLAGLDLDYMSELEDDLELDDSDSESE
jgi:hypothetical protein